MKKSFLLLAILLLAGSAYSFDTSALQLSLWAPKAQIVPDYIDISGLKLNLPYGGNEYVGGVDLGIVSSNTNVSALQINLANNTADDYKGFQVGLMNFSGTSSGFCVGAILNYTEGLSYGVSIGLINTAMEVRGVQIGIVNYTEFLTGFQIGLANIATKSTVPFFPIINFCF